MKYDEPVEFECPICGKTFQYDECIRGDIGLNDKLIGKMTHDCHGIPFRTVCCDCYDKIMNTKGYDGEYYTPLDECIDYDY